MGRAELEALKREIEALSPPAALRFAADLLELGRAELAHTIADKVVAELGATLALAMLKKRKP